MAWGDNTSTEYIRQVVCRQLLQPIVLALTYGRHSTDAEGRSCGREAELIQYCVGPCWINHCNITAGGRARNYPHRTLAERDGYGVWKDEWRETTCPWEVLVMVGWHCTWWLEWWPQLLFNQDNDKTYCGLSWDLRCDCKCTVQLKRKNKLGTTFKCTRGKGCYGRFLCSKVWQWKDLP